MCFTFAPTYLQDVAKKYTEQSSLTNDLDMHEQFSFCKFIYFLFKRLVLKLINEEDEEAAAKADEIGPLQENIARVKKLIKSNQLVAAVDILTEIIEVSVNNAHSCWFYMGVFAR